jgi:hypothetical protein
VECSDRFQEVGTFLLALEGNDPAAVSLITQPAASFPSPTSPYHHIAGVPLRGHNKELRLMLTASDHWLMAGYYRHGTDSMIVSNDPWTAMPVHRICIPATVRWSGDDYPRMILRRSQEACRESFYPGVRAEVEERRDVTMYKRNLRSEVVSSDAKFKASRFDEQCRNNMLLASRKINVESCRLHIKP